MTVPVGSWLKTLQLFALAAFMLQPGCLFRRGGPGPEPLPIPADSPLKPTWDAAGGSEYVYQIPKNSDGVIFFFHGLGGGAVDWVGRVEPRILLEEALNAGYGVVAIDSSNRNRKMWTKPSPLLGNPDVDVFRAVVAELEENGKMNKKTPRFAVGISNGGAWVSVLSSFEKFSGVAILSARGQPEYLDDLGPETAVLFSYGVNDHLIPANEIEPNIDLVRRQQCPTKTIVIEKTAMNRQQFARIPGIGTNGSREIYAALEGVGVINKNGMVVVNPMDRERYSSAIPSKYRTYRIHIFDQLQVSWAGHTMFRQIYPELIAFFNKQR